LSAAVSKTKDMTIDFRTEAHSSQYIFIKGEKCVESYTYLGTIIYNKLCFDVHTSFILLGSDLFCTVFAVERSKMKNNLYKY